MPKSEGQKLKLLYLADLLRRETDEDHALSMSDILSRLEELGVHAERKSIYDDLRALEDYGMDIIATRGRAGGYQLAHREFELPELKLLVDAVQSSKFLSVKKSRELIRKLEGLASRWEAQSLQRQVYAVGRVKSMNESIYYSIDTIHTAISQDRQIAFRYFEWTMEKTVRYRRDGQLYERSPYALVWDDENYYLVAYDHTASPPGIRHYRVDKMANLSVLEESRLGDIRRLRHGAVRQTDVRDVRRCAAGRRAAVRRAAGRRGAGPLRQGGHTAARRRQLFPGACAGRRQPPVHGLGGRLRHGRKAAWAACRGAGIHRLLPGDARAVRISVKSPDYGTYNILY